MDFTSATNAPILIKTFATLQAFLSSFKEKEVNICLSSNILLFYSENITVSVSLENSFEGDFCAKIDSSNFSFFKSVGATKKALQGNRIAVSIKDSVLQLESEFGVVFSTSLVEVDFDEVLLPLQAELTHLDLKAINSIDLFLKSFEREISSIKLYSNKLEFLGQRFQSEILLDDKTKKVYLASFILSKTNWTKIKNLSSLYEGLIGFSLIQEGFIWLGFDEFSVRLPLAKSEPSFLNVLKTLSYETSFNIPVKGLLERISIFKNLDKEHNLVKVASATEKVTFSFFEDKEEKNKFSLPLEQEVTFLELYLKATHLFGLSNLVKKQQDSLKIEYRGDAEPIAIKTKIFDLPCQLYFMTSITS